MKYNQTRNSLMKYIGKIMPEWWFSKSPTKFSIRFKTEINGKDFLLWSKDINYNKDLLILGPKISKTVSFESIYKIYPVEIFNHKYGLHFELKNGSSFTVGE